jgi:hypothetical protein
MVGDNSLSHIASGGGGKPIYKVCYSLCTCKCVRERRKGGIHALARLASPGGMG